LIKNRIQSLLHYIKKDNVFLIGVSALTITGLLDSYSAQINLNQISEEQNPIGRYLLEHFGTAGLYYFKISIIAFSSGMVKLTKAKLKYSPLILYAGSAYWGAGAASWYLPLN